MVKNQKDGTWWTSRWRVLGCMYGGLLIVMVSWPGSYLVWLSQGCLPFLPFVSDFGDGPTGQVFEFGMSLAPILLIPTWFDYQNSIRASLQGQGPIWQRMHAGIPFMGVCCSISVVCVALNPWDYSLPLHLVGAFGIFFGGAIFSFLASVIDWQRGFPSCFAFFLSLVSATSLLLMFAFLWRGSHEIRAADLPAEMHSSSSSPSMRLMREDYSAYCRGEEFCMGATCVPTLHSNWKINAGAFCEWLLLGSVALLGFMKLHVELHDWPVCARAAHAERLRGSVAVPLMD